MMHEKKKDESKITADKANNAQDQLLYGKKTINQVRKEFGLNTMNDSKLNKPIIKE